MATYTGTPSTVAAGETILASLWNSDVRDPVAALSGAWNSYTPTLGVFTAGNGTATGSYIRVGKLIVFKAKFTFGSTSAATTGVPTLTGPATAASTTPFGPLQGILYDSSVTLPYLAAASWTTTNAVAVGLLGTSGARTNCTTTTPFTWATGDQILVSGVYEAA